MRQAVLFIATLFLLGCRDNGTPIENLPPDTQLQVDTIVRNGDLRLGTNVNCIGMEQTKTDTLLDIT